MFFSYSFFNKNCKLLDLVLIIVAKVKFFFLLEKVKQKFFKRFKAKKAPRINRSAFRLFFYFLKD